MSNLIEAWDKAKEGQKLKRKNPLKVSLVRQGDFLNQIALLSDEDRYANDWVRVVPKKKEQEVDAWGDDAEMSPVQSGIVEWFRNEDGYKIPVATFGDDDTENLNFDSLVGKRTRITIEVL